MYRRILFLASVLALLAAAPARAGLVAYWAADGNALDSSGNGHDGTLENGAGFGPGYSGQAFALDGVNQYVSVPNSPAFSFGTGSFTVALWANFDSIRPGPPGAAPNTFIGDDDGPGSQDKWGFYYDSSGNLEFHINSPSTGAIFLASPETFTPALGTWNFYAVTRSGDTFTFYVNGVSLGTATSSAAILPISAPLTIGEIENLGYFNGSLDELRIYNQALTSSQIANLAGVPEPSGLVLLGTAGLILIGLRASRSSRT